MSGVCIVVFLVYFRYIFYVIPTCHPAKDKSPTLWDLLVISHNSKFGVHLSIFYMIVGG
jgi:hypothetical protein